MFELFQLLNNANDYVLDTMEPHFSQADENIDLSMHADHYVYHKHKYLTDIGWLYIIFPGRYPDSLCCLI